MLIEATSDYEILRGRNASVKELLETQRRIVDESIQESNRLQREGKALLTVCTDLLAQAQGELNEFLRNQPASQTTEELEGEIESEKARLELMHEGNGGVIKEFENRTKKIDALTTRLEEVRNALSELDDKIKELRDEWEPELDSLVGKISESFSWNMEEISCAGEVGVHKDDDFDQWAIQIRVKFRYAFIHPTSSAKSNFAQACATLLYRTVILTTLQRIRTAHDT